MARGAQVVAEFLAGQPKITRIHYPGLPGDPGHGVAAGQMTRGFGGMLAFDVGDDEEDAKRFIAALRTIYHAVSLGATESLVCIPYLTTMLYLPPERVIARSDRAAADGVSGGVAIFAARRSVLQRQGFNPDDDSAEDTLVNVPPPGYERIALTPFYSAYASCP